MLHALRLAQEQLPVMQSGGYFNMAKLEVDRAIHDAERHLREPRLGLEGK